MDVDREVSFLRAILQHLPLFVARFDADLRIAFINKLQPGLRWEEVEGRSTFDFVEPAYHEVHRSSIAEALRTGQPQSYEVKGTGAQGRRAHYRSTVVPLSSEGTDAPGIAVVACEITDLVENTEELRRSEEKLRFAVAATGLGLWSWNPATGDIEWNERMHEITGSADVLGTEAYVERLVAPEYREAVLESSREMSRGRPLFVAHAIIRPDGERRWVVPAGSVETDETGQVTRVVGGLVDAQEQRQLEEQLRAAQKRESIGELTAGVAHNFNNLLAVMLPALELAQQSTAVDDRAIFDEAVHAARRAAELVGHLMKFGGQQVSAEPSIIDPSTLARRVLAMCQRTLDRQVKLDLALEGELPAVLGREADLEQVLFNLILNAQQACRGESPHIHLVLDAASGGSIPALRIRVRDNGAGMEDSVRARIFEPFFTTKAPGQGTGLGLAVSAEIVRAHGGTITCESTPGAGSVFTVLLPGRSDSPRGPQVAVDPPTAARLATILVVDDEAAIRSVVKRILGPKGYRVETVSNAREALDHLTDASLPDLILLDRSMPGISGEKALAAVRSVAPAVPILLFTGQDVTPAESRLADGVLFKPLSTEQLHRAIQEHLRAD